MNCRTTRTILFWGVLPCLVFLSFVFPGNLRAQTSVVSGIVSEAASGEAVIGVSVILSKDETGGTSAAVVRGARTNKFGFYSLPSVPEGTYFLIVRGIGYTTFSKRIDIPANGSELRVNVPLATRDVKSQSVTVQGEREASPTRSISAVQLQSDFITKMPTFGGETDIFRTLQLMPGIKAGSEISSGLYIRGGSPDQNLTLLDGVIVYNPSHLAGIFSVFNNDAIRDVRVIKGAFPAEYGGRLSSVIDLTMKEGSKEKIGGTANLSLIASRLTVEGPITEDITFMISGRRTYIDLILGLVLPEEERKRAPNYNFYDLNAKLNYKISDNDRIFASGYFGSDFMKQDIGGSKFNMDWGNATGNLRWMHIVSPSLFTNFSAIYTDYRFGVDIGPSDSGSATFKTFSQIRDFTLRGDVQYFPAPEHNIKTGAEATFHRFAVSSSMDKRPFGEVVSDAWNGSPAEALEASVYAQDEWQLTPELSANLGFRLSYFLRGNHLLPEPRISFAYNLSDDISIKGAAAVANQFLHLVVRNNIPLPTDTWFPSGDTIKPANSVQYTLGAEAKLFGGEYLVSVEGYYKSMRNLYEFRDGAASGNPFVTADAAPLTEGTGEAYGMEFFLNKRIGAFTGWIGYTLSWTTRTFAELNNGKPFFPRYDRRHDVSVVLNYKFSEAWELGASWVFGTGQAYTMPTAQYFFPTDPSSHALVYDSQKQVAGITPDLSGIRDIAPMGATSPQPRINYTERNGFRIPDFHKLDLNFTHYFTWFGLPFNASINVYNTYNRQNPFMVSVQYKNVALPSSGSRKYAQVPWVQQVSLFPILPTLAIGFKF